MLHIHARDLMFYTRPNTTDAQIVKEVVNEDVYSIWGNVLPTDNYIDIGAHIGAFSVFAASLGARVYAFEAMQETYDLLVKNLELNESSVSPYHAAVMGKRAQNQKLYIRDSNLGGNNMYGETNPDARFELVDSITLKDVFLDTGLNSCDLLKLDCEGAELEILEAFGDFNRLKRIAVETHRENWKQVLSLLKKTHRLKAKSDEKNPIMLFERLT